MSLKIKQTYELVRIDGDVDVLKEHPRNPRRGNVEAIEESVENNGWYGAIVAQKSTGYILAGNHRYRVAVAKGAKEVPVIWHDVDDETAVRILLADNRTADLGTYDEQTLGELLEGLETLDGTGYGLGHLQVQLEADNGAKGGNEGANDSGPADVDDIGDDRYTPQYAVIVTVEDEDAQRALYEFLEPYLAEGQEKWANDAQMKVVAI